MRDVMMKCPVCGWQGSEFATYDGGYGHKLENTCCPVCDSQPRHRLIYVYLASYLTQISLTPGKEKYKLKVLDFCPHKCLLDYFQSMNDKLDYLTVDIMPGYAMQVEDITNMSFPDNQFDLIICMHILEHVEHDKTGIKELKRVLKPGGTAVIDVPMDMSRESTYEDPLNKTPEERTKAYWYYDHLRIYGRDFPEILRQEGFNVKSYRYRDLMSEEDFRRYAVYDRPVIVCSK